MDLETSREHPAIITEAQYQAYLADLIAGKRANCAAMVQRLLSGGMPVKSLYTDVYQRSMYEVGGLWEAHRISVATEHIATSVTEALLPLSYPQVFSAPRCGQRAIVSCAANEYHQIGAKMVADIMEMNGWDTRFLGANTPPDAIVSVIQDFHPDVACLSLSVFHHFASLLMLTRMVRESFKDLPIWIGGQALRHGGRKELEAIPGVQCLMSLDELERKIQ